MNTKEDKFFHEKCEFFEKIFDDDTEYKWLLSEGAKMDEFDSDKLLEEDNFFNLDDDDDIFGIPMETNSPSENSDTHAKPTGKMKRDDSDHDSLECKRLQCSQCYRTFDEKSTLEVHLKSHLRRKKIKQRNMEPLSGEKNRMQVESASKGFMCQTCNNLFKSQKALTNHMKTVHLILKQHKCNICEFQFKAKESLKNHMAVHSSQRPYSCKICGHTSKRKKDLNVHMHRHSKPKLIKCSSCSYECREKYELKHHSKVHHDARPFLCNICNYSSKLKSCMKIHQLTVHSDKRMYECAKCTYRFPNEASFTSHKCKLWRSDDS